jgi:hypothetical protein
LQIHNDNGDNDNNNNNNNNNEVIMMRKYTADSIDNEIVSVKLTEET